MVLISCKELEGSYSVMHRFSCGHWACWLHTVGSCDLSPLVDCKLLVLKKKAIPMGRGSELPPRHVCCEDFMGGCAFILCTTRFIMFKHSHRFVQDSPQGTIFSNPIMPPTPSSFLIQLAETAFSSLQPYIYKRSFPASSPTKFHSSRKITIHS